LAEAIGKRGDDHLDQAGELLGRPRHEVGPAEALDVLAGHGDGMVNRGPLVPGRVNHAPPPMADVLARERAEPAEAFVAARIAEPGPRVAPADSAGGA